MENRTIAQSDLRAQVWMRRAIRKNCKTPFACRRRRLAKGVLQEAPRSCQRARRWGRRGRIRSLIRRNVREPSTVTCCRAKRVQRRLPPKGSVEVQRETVPRGAVSFFVSAIGGACKTSGLCMRRVRASGSVSGLKPGFLNPDSWRLQGYAIASIDRTNNPRPRDHRIFPVGWNAM